MAAQFAADLDAARQQATRDELAARLTRLTSAEERHGCPVLMIELPDLVVALNHVHSLGRTALVLDRSEDGRVDTFLSYQVPSVVPLCLFLFSRVAHYVHLSLCRRPRLSPACHHH